MISNSTAWGKSISIISFSLIICCCSSFAKKKKPYQPEPSKRDTETILGIQIYLDENNFGPGKIDGQMGQFTRKAVAHYNFSKGITYDNYYEVIQSSKANITELFTTYTIEDKDFTYVGEVSLEPEEQSKIEYMYY